MDKEYYLATYRTNIVGAVLLLMVMSTGSGLLDSAYIKKVLALTE